jgi:hypothetical protein
VPSLDLLRCKLLFHSIPSGSADAGFGNIVAYFRRFSTREQQIKRRGGFYHSLCLMLVHRTVAF